jgi:alpha-L-rhamnosidase
MYYVLNLAEYYLYSGDTSFAESQYQVMKNELADNAASVDPTTGLTTVAGSDWDFYDGSKGGSAAQGGAVTASNVTYYEALANAAWLAAQLAASDPGNANAATWTADAASWSSQAAALKASINKYLFNASLGAYQLSSSSNGTHAATSVPQDANAEAVVYGLAPATDVTGILSYLKNNLWGTYGPQPYSPDANYSTVISPFVSGYELDARFASGDTSDALALINLLWAQMVNQNGPFYTGTLWEKLGQNGQDTDSNASLAHGWATAPVSALSSYLLGIQPTGPGYSTWSIAPQPGTLSWAQGQVPTPSGTPVVSRWEAGSNSSSFELTMSAPAGTTGTVAVPELGASRVIAEDGQIVWAGGAPVGSVSATEANGAVVFSNVSGAHTFAWVASPTSADVCTLTKEYVDGSANYQKLTPVQQKVVDALVTATCTILTQIGPNTVPSQKQAFIRAYDQSVQALAKKGWVTQTQSSTLQALAAGL